MEGNDYTAFTKEELIGLLKEKDEEISSLESKCDRHNLFSSGKVYEIPLINDIHEENETKTSRPSHNSLSNNDISRYSRQLILPELGVKGQLKLKNSSVLIVGGGGLGCPASLYLAAAGIGRIGVIDYDQVDVSNLHRQVSHTEDRVGISKALSIAQTCKSLNSSIECVPYHFQINSSNALQVVQRYDVILDATDNVATRYLLNDACVLAGRPLVSGSALRFEGQMTVYNFNRGPCYRCLFPQPPPPETVTNCSDGGVLGVVPGIIGSMQALEAIKIAAGLESSYSQRMLLFDALDGTFRTIKLRPKSPGCAICGDKPTLHHLIDYEQFCGATASDKDKNLELLSSEDRLLPVTYSTMLNSKSPHLLIDVRNPVEMDICRLPHQAINIPFPAIEKDPEEVVRQIEQQLALVRESDREVEDIPVVCVCRRGNLSQLAVQILKKYANRLNNKHHQRFLDILGGLHGWSRKVDPDFPTY